MSSTRGRWPEFRIEIPTEVTLECPECHAQIECGVELDRDSYYGPTLAIAVAGIDTWRCEECRQHGCPECVSFPHPDDPGLLLCASCAGERAR
jgi:hypothetical protein